MWRRQKLTPAWQAAGLALLGGGVAALAGPSLGVLAGVLVLAGMWLGVWAGVVLGRWASYEYQRWRYRGVLRACGCWRAIDWPPPRIRRPCFGRCAEPWWARDAFLSPFVRTWRSARRGRVGRLRAPHKIRFQRQEAKKGKPAKPFKFF